MYELPASVRLALWGTHAIRYGMPMEDAAERALPDVDFLSGSLERLETWRDFGERAICVDLPRPGGQSDLITPGTEGFDAAVLAGECIFVPSLGGLIVPELEIYGPPGDEGLRADLRAFDSEPVPIHRLQMLALPDIDRRFKQSLITHIDELERLDIHPFSPEVARAQADDRLAAARWALPPDLAPRAVRIMTTAGLVIAALDEALAHSVGVDAAGQHGRDVVLRRLLREAETAIAEAATVASLTLAGIR